MHGSRWCQCTHRSAHPENEEELHRFKQASADLARRKFGHAHVRHHKACRSTSQEKGTKQALVCLRVPLFSDQQVLRLDVPAGARVLCKQNQTMLNVTQPVDDAPCVHMLQGTCIKQHPQTIGCMGSICSKTSTTAAQWNWAWAALL